MKKLFTVVSLVFCATFLFSSVTFSLDAKSLKGENFFTRTNFKAQGGVVFFHNMSNSKTIIPAGTPVTIVSAYPRSIKFRMTGDAKKTYTVTDSRDVYAKYFVKDKSEIGLEAMNEKAREAVKNMTIYQGMTKNEVFVSKGCPAYIAYGIKSWGCTLEKLMASDTWYYNIDTRSREMIVTFKDGVVSGIKSR